MRREPSIAIVTAPTRLQSLLSRWGTKGQAKFYLKQAHAHQELEGAAPALADAGFEEYVEEDRTYRQAVAQLRSDLQLGPPVSHVDRRYLATFDFRNTMLVVVVGPDGLVANAAKYVGDRPLIGVNPDPQRWDGILLPFAVDEVRGAVQQCLKGGFSSRLVTLAEASLNDGQRLLAFNDLFIGRKTHVSARYTLTAGGASEAHSSSGVLVVTGAGSTGWLSSVFNMTSGVARWSGGQCGEPLRMQWEDRRLAWVVREPFVSRQSGANLVAGALEGDQQLSIESLMPEEGVIFSDGVESDYVQFNSGAIARIGLAKQQAVLVARG